MAEPWNDIQHQTTPFWSLPLNIAGLNQESMARIVEDDLGDLLFEYSCEPLVPVFRADRRSGLLDFGPLHAIAEERISDLGHFFRDVACVLDALNDGARFRDRTDLTALSGDPHHHGRRPLRLKVGARDMVLKFSDPRPYQLLSHVLGDLSDALSFNLLPPEILASKDSRWYLIPFLESDENTHSDPDAFMRDMGGLTALAFALRMIDLHYENIIVSGGKPVIVDPECTPYPFGEEDVEQRLYDTRLLTHKPHTSGLRGGEFTKEHRPGGLNASPDYRGRRPAPSLNRIRDNDGKLIDPASHRSAFFAGYRSAHDWCVRNAAAIADQLRHHLSDDYRIRYLYRNTVQYIATIEVLNVPMNGEYADWREVVYNRFRHAPHFGEQPLTPAALAAECADMDRRDVPYFWVNAGETAVRHSNGIVENLNIAASPRDLATHSVLNLHQVDIEEQIVVIDRFFDQPVEPTAD